MINKVVHKAASRGHANHGWLQANHSFSFGNWFDKDKIQFGVLRVLNDDIIAGGMGFGTHPHANMEIITIPLEGDLAHKDSMGNEAIIKTGEIQVMSAGTGVEHSEFNPNAILETKLFQIWLFPNKQNVTPRYQQITFDKSKQLNNFAQIVSPNQTDDNVWIHQDAWFYLSDFELNFSKKLNLKKAGNGFYIIVIEGAIEIENEKLERRDAIGIWNASQIEIKALAKAKFLIMEVPMQIEII